MKFPRVYTSVLASNSNYEKITMVDVALVVDLTCVRKTVIINMERCRGKKYFQIEKDGNNISRFHSNMLLNLNLQT